MRFYSIREMLARKIAPFVFDRLNAAERQHALVQKYLDQAKENAAALETNTLNDVVAGRRHKRALHQIAALETPKCASIGRRMAAIAREGLK